MPVRRTPLLVLVISLALTLLATTVVAVTGRERDEARFRNATTAARAAIVARLDTYVAMLRAANGLFTASGSVRPSEFATFVSRFELHPRYPGVQGIGFARHVRPAALDSVIAARRAEGIPEFRVWPAEPRADYYPIVFLEPLDARNRAALGYDMFTHPVRREAMERARDEGVPVISGRVRLVQEIDPGREQAGFLVYHAVYDGPSEPASVAERRARLLGWVYAPFRAGDLFAGIFPIAPPVAFRVYDLPAADSARLLYDSRSDRGRAARAPAPAFTHVDTVPILGRRWAIAYASLPAVEERSGRVLAPAVAIVGALVSLLLFALTRAEALARAAAERSERSRGRFFAAMSHELRTPLNAILGYNDLLLAGVYGTLPPEQEAGLLRSQRAARHLHELVNDVLDLSKIEAGKVELEVSDVHLPAVVEELFSTLHAVAAVRGAALRLECDGEVRPIRSDARRVRQILLNLLSNAIKFGEGRPVIARCTPLHHGVRVEVRDQGVGIPFEVQEHIFEEFVQLPNAESGGTGLGLAISRRLALLLGGSLTVNSVPGHGSTFTLDLPAEVPHRRP